MKLTFYGHSCLLAEHEGVRVVIDPFLSGNPAKPMDPGELQVDAVILTHGHDDHFGDSTEIAVRNRCPVIAIYELANICAMKGAEAHGMNLGGSSDFQGFRVKFVPALHSSSVRLNGQVHYAGVAAGILLTMGGKTLYHAGDTALFSDMKLIGDSCRIDAAALPIGDYYTMGPEEAVLAAEWIRPGIVIPIHHNTFPGIQQDVHAFSNALEAKGIPCRPLGIGESVSL